MSSGTPPAAPPFRKGRKPEKPDVMTDSAPATNEELKTKLMDAQTELQQERGKVRGAEQAYLNNSEIPQRVHIYYLQYSIFMLLESKIMLKQYN